MNILDLDVYSLRMIFSMLEPECYTNAMQTCRTFRKLTCQCVVDQRKWTINLKKRFVLLVGSIVDRDNMYNTHKAYYVILASLKAFLQMIKVTDFLRYSLTYTEEIGNNDFSKLISKAAVSKDFCLDQVIHLSHFLSISANISNWFTFDLQDGTRLVICCVLSSTLYLFFVVNSVETILYHSEDGSSWNTLTFDKDGESSKLAVDVREENILENVRKLSLLAFNDENHLSLNTFLEFSKFSFPFVVNHDHNSDPADTCDPVTEMKINHLQLAFKSNISQILTILPHDRSKGKFLNFFKLLNTYKGITDFDSIVKYTQALMRYSVPFTKVLCRFGYGELLGYLPIAQKLLMRAEYSQTTEKDVTLNIGQSKILIKRTSLKRDFLINVTDIATSESYQVQLEEAALSEDEQLGDLIKLFDNFVDVSFKSPKLDLIPEISVAFLRDMFSCLFANLSHLI